MMPDKDVAAAQVSSIAQAVVGKMEAEADYTDGLHAVAGIFKGL